MLAVRPNDINYISLKGEAKKPKPGKTMTTTARNIKKHPADHDDFEDLPEIGLDDGMPLGEFLWEITGAVAVAAIRTRLRLARRRLR